MNEDSGMTDSDILPYIGGSHVILVILKPQRRSDYKRKICDIDPTYAKTY